MTPLPVDPSPHRSKAPQFNATPRFTLSSTPQPAATQTLPTSTPRFATPARWEGWGDDVIDESSDDPPRDARGSMEGEGEGEGDEDEDEQEKNANIVEERTPKRRRKSSSPAENEPGGDSGSSSPMPILPFPPPTIQRRGPSTAPRFLPATPASPSLSQYTQAFSRPPRFQHLDPSQQSPIQAEPLPEQFSPHRRGQKYLAGGLAAEVRGWLFNIESTVHSTPGQRSQQDPWLIKIIVDEVSGGDKAGMTLVRGRRIHQVETHSAASVDRVREVKMILAGESAGSGIQKGTQAKVGQTVGVKGPIWEIVLEGVKWGVGTDWKVL